MFTLKELMDEGRVEFLPEGFVRIYFRNMEEEGVAINYAENIKHWKFSNVTAKYYDGWKITEGWLIYYIY